MLIKNRSKLLSHGNTGDRKTVLDVLTAGLIAPDPYTNTKEMVRLTKSSLIIGMPEFFLPKGKEPLVFDLDKINNIYVVGGGASLMALPAAGLTLQDLLAVNRLLYFENGASMGEINALRFPMTNLRSKHVRHVHGATLIKLDVDEQPLKGRNQSYDSLRAAYPDAYDRAFAVLEKYDCWDKIPDAVRVFLKKRDPKYADATAAEVRQRPFYHFRVSGPEYMLEAARDKAISMGINAAIIATSLNDIEARPVAQTFAQMARETEINGRPLEPPCVFILGGELVVKVGNSSGSGGRNQEFVVSAAERIAGSENIVIASADCDGTDGPTDTAGGIVDGYTMERSAKAGIDLLRELSNHNTSHVLKTLGDTIDLRRGSNVRDLRIMYVSNKAD